MPEFRHATLAKCQDCPNDLECWEEVRCTIIASDGSARIGKLGSEMTHMPGRDWSATMGICPTTYAV